MINKQNDPRRTGKCELCGGHDRELKILFVGDFFGWACEICRQQIRESTVRMFCSAGEESEPVE